MHPIWTFFHEFEWIHVGLGLMGNLAFVVGSVFFLFDPLKDPGIWLFVAGSAGMLLGSIGSAVVKLSRVRPEIERRLEGRPSDA